MMSQSTLAKTRLPNSGASKPPRKRLDIQGLRAVAVLAVVFDHLFHWPSGGFVGVDVFFLISGFLITGLLLREHDRTGAISFSGFYRRRIRRIMPAALTVLIATLAAAYFVFSGARAQGTLIDAIWSLFFSANWHFAAIGTDYFQAGGPVSPLQHFWSLAVEEQFYFVWPWLMLFTFWASAKAARLDKSKARTVIAIVMAACVALSFSWAAYESIANPTSAYFSTFSRAWELALGGLIAVMAPAFSRIPAAMRPILAWAGLAGIVWSVFAITSDMSFPAPWAAAPVLATMLVIVAGTGGEQRFLWPLTNKVSGYVGDISYSLYLWHFPVIIFMQALIPDQTPVFHAVALGTMFVLSVASFHLVEEPIRRSGWLIAKPKGRGHQKPLRSLENLQYVGLAILTIATVAVTAAAFIQSAPMEAASPAKAPNPIASSSPGAPGQPADDSPQGTLSRQISEALQAKSFPDFNPSVDSLGIENWSKRPEIACMNVTEGNLASCLTGPANAAKTVAVLGDSHAAAWLPGIRAALEPLGYKVQALTMGQCPAAAVTVTLEGGAAFPQCAEHQQWAAEKVREIHPDLTILASAQGSTMSRLASGSKGKAAAAEIAAGLETTLDQIAGNTGRVTVLSSPVAGKNMQECVTRVGSPSNCVSRLTDDWKALRDAEKIAVTGKKMSYVDTALWFCDNTGSCPGFVNQTPVRVDTGHLTVEYSRKLAPVLAPALQ